MIPGHIVATRTPRDLHADAIRCQLQDALKEMGKAADADKRVAYANEAVDFGVSILLFYQVVLLTPAGLAVRPDCQTDPGLPE